MVREEFRSRVVEIETYFNFLKEVDYDFKQLTDFEASKFYRIDDELVKILKANGFLLLYNLIESTILNCIVAIFDELRMKNIEYKDLTEQLKKYWIKNKYKHDPKVKDETIVNQFYLIIKEIVDSVSIDINKSRIDFAGSLDTEKIMTVVGQIGVTLNLSHFRLDKHKLVFEDIVKNRNNLAHGKLTFSQVAEDITYKGETRELGSIEKIDKFGMVHYKNYTIEHLEKVIDSIEAYILSESYIKA